MSMRVGALKRLLSLSFCSNRKEKEMSTNDFWGWTRGIIIFMVIVGLVAGGFVGLIHLGGKNREKNCAALGEQIGYNTKVGSEWCLIEIQPNLWVPDHQIAEFLPLIDCEKDF